MDGVCWGVIYHLRMRFYRNYKEERISKGTVTD